MNRTYKMLCVKIAFGVLCLVVSSSAFQRRVIDKGDHLLICEHEPMEFGIVLDSSSSIKGKEFQKAKRFLQSFLKQFQIGDGPHDVRVSIITYGKGIYPEVAFNLTTYKTKAQVLRAIGKIPHKAGLYTDTGMAISYMHYSQMSPKVVRPGVVKIGLVITDGNSQLWPVTRDAALAAREDDIVMFAVGIGQRIRKKELFRIAGNHSRVTMVQNFDKLESIKNELGKQTCIREAKPSTTIGPMGILGCGQKRPSDINFIFSPASLGLDATAWATSFISTTIDSHEMKEGFQYGVLAGSCPIDSGFQLDTYKTNDEIKDHLQRFDKDRLANLIKTAGKHGFSQANGGRPIAKKVAVIFINGRKWRRGKKGGNEIELRIEELKANGVEVYVANPAGFELKIDGAIGLSGRSSRQQSEELINRMCG